MSGSWNPAKYREEAETLPPGKERDACVVLAEGYANLAALIENALIEKENNGCIGGPCDARDVLRNTSNPA